MAAGPSRRSVLIGTAAGAGLALAGCGGPDGPTAGTSVSGAFDSRYRGGRSTGWTIVRPPGHEGASLPVLVVLHGRGGNHSSAYTGIHLDEVLARYVAAGGRPFALASIDGGDTYWHPRRGSDTSAMVIEQFLPLLVQHGLQARPTDRIGLLGWSMGGYGALYLSTVLRSSRVAVTVAESPAIWHEAGQSAAGAFDDAADFDAHQIWGRQQRLSGIALRVDCGDEDGFAPVTRDLRASITPTPAGGIEAGAHDNSYWHREAPAQLAFIGAHLG